MHSSNKSPCPSGQYSNVLEECRPCEWICGEQYGGSANVECMENCPGYGQSTHATTLVTQMPSFENDYLPWWIWVLVVASSVILVVLIIMLVVCLKKSRRCQKKCWLQVTEEPGHPGPEKVCFVTQESDQNGKAAMVVSRIQNETVHGSSAHLKDCNFSI